jgi:hypothetical protein
LKVVGAAASYAANWNPKSFGALLLKMDKLHLDTVKPLFETISTLTGDVTSLKS